MSEEERRALALLLVVAARALVFVFVVAVAVRLFPVQALDPAWQMTVCAGLLNQAALPLLALVLMHAASAVLPADGRLASARLRWRGLAVAATLGFALLLPNGTLATLAPPEAGPSPDAVHQRSRPLAQGD